jgi:ABC-type branched-subunit amino acid transport system ATPase component
MAEMLEVRNLVAKYGDFQALFGIDFAMAKAA